MNSTLDNMQKQVKEFESFSEFYPFYLSEHRNTNCRRLHFIGSSLVLIALGFILLNSAWTFIWIIPVFGYGFAWLGHYYFEKNKPATFTHPLYSFLGDWVLFKDILVGKIKG